MVEAALCRSLDPRPVGETYERGTYLGIPVALRRAVRAATTALEATHWAAGVFWLLVAGTTQPASWNAPPLAGPRTRMCEGLDELYHRGFAAPSGGTGPRSLELSGSAELVRPERARRGAGRSWQRRSWPALAFAIRCGPETTPHRPRT